MSNNAAISEQLKIGQSVTIARGPLEGVAGILYAYRGAQWVIELPECGPGILLLIAPEYCEPVL